MPTDEPTQYPSFFPTWIPTLSPSQDPTENPSRSANATGISPTSAASKDEWIDKVMNVVAAGVAIVVVIVLLLCFFLCRFYSKRNMSDSDHELSLARLQRKTSERHRSLDDIRGILAASHRSEDGDSELLPEETEVFITDIEAVDQSDHEEVSEEVVVSGMKSKRHSPGARLLRSRSTPGDDRDVSEKSLSFEPGAATTAAAVTVNEREAVCDLSQEKSDDEELELMYVEMEGVPVDTVQGSEGESYFEGEPVMH
jgi:hypothetical protein